MLVRLLRWCRLSIRTLPQKLHGKSRSSQRCRRRFESSKNGRRCRGCISGQKAFDNPRSALCVVLMLVKKPSNLLFQLELTSRVGQ
jgi:hypothetical protein